MSSGATGPEVYALLLRLLSSGLDSRLRRTVDRGIFTVKGGGRDPV